MNNKLRNKLKVILVFAILASITINVFAPQFIYAGIAYSNSYETDKSKAGNYGIEKHEGKCYLFLYDSEGVKHYYEYSASPVGQSGSTSKMISLTDQNEIREIYFKISNDEFDASLYMFDTSAESTENLEDYGAIPQDDSSSEKNKTTDKSNTTKKGSYKKDKDGTLYFEWKDENGKTKKITYTKKNIQNRDRYVADTSDSELWKEAQEYGASMEKSATASSMATLDEVEKVNNKGNTVDEEQSDDDSYFAKFVNGAAGFFLYPLKILPLLFGKILQTIMGIFTENNGALSVDDILFNRLDITKIDFFNLSTGNEIVDTIRAGVAEWYYGLRNISAVVLFSILIYVGLRMSLSTIAEEKAKYSQMIVNWIESIALLFVLHYLIILIISLNNQIVTIIGKNIDKTDPIDKIYTNAWSVGFVEGFGSAVCYLILVVMTFVFLLSYLKRMITIGFLIVIAPLVTITYSIDKMGDNKSQALGTWFKEFCYNILIQPFQCVSYIVLASSAMKILDDEASLSAMIVAIMMIMFVYESEKIIRHIFHFEARTMSETVSQAAFVGSTIGLFAGASGKKIDTSDDAIKEKNKKNEKTFAKMQENVENANLNSENTVKQNTTQNNANGSNASKHKRNHNVGNAISAVTNNRLAQSYANMARTGSKLLLQGGLALGTGNTSTFLNTEAKILRNGKIEGQDYIEERNKHELQQAYEEATEEAKNNMINNMVMKTMGVDNLDDLDESQQQIANRLKNEIENTEGKSIKEQAKNYVALRAKDIASGDDAKTQSEQKIKEVVNKLKRTYNKDGMSDKYAYSQINEDIANAKEGKYSKATHLGMEAKQRLDDVKEVGNIVKDTGNALGQSGKKFLNAVSTPGRKIQRYYRGKKQQ